MVFTNAQKTKRNYDLHKEIILARKRAAYAKKKLEKNLPIVEEPPLESTSQLIEIQPETELKFESVFIPIEPEPITIDTFTQVSQMINSLENESLGNRRFRINNFKTIINIIKPVDYTDLIFKLTKQPNKVIKLFKNFEYQPLKTYSINSLITFYKSILFFVDKFNIPIKSDKKIKYEDQIQISDVVSSQELEVKNNNVSIPKFSEYLNKVIQHFGINSREYLISKMYEELKCRDDLQLILVRDYIKANPEKNYIIVNEFDQANVIINKYKTADRYGPINVKLSSELTNLIKNYILTHKIDNDELFFNTKNNSTIVSKMNKKLGYEGFGAINLFRKMIASDSKDLPLKEQLKVAKQMTHSLKVHNSNYIIKESI
jgi:hypothetical protein